VVSVTAAGTKIKVTQASLSEAIDALAAAAGFKVTYEGARPGAMLFNAEVDTPSTAQTLFRLIDGQNLNYAVMFDLSGKKITSLMVLGLQSKSAGTASTTAAGGRPQPFTPPRSPRGDVPVVEDEVAVEQEATPSPAPTVSPSPSTSPLPQKGGPGGPGSPFPPSPFAPRPFGAPYGARPTPSPSP